jgi:peptidyl-prolyl cis-trans isomerase A (cyclophilin A)
LEFLLKLPVLLIASAALLSACGGSGGDSSTPATQNKVSITEVTSDQLVYRKTSVITVKGQNLNLGINFSHQGCLKITELAGSTATQKVFSCKIIAVGSVPVVISDGSANSLYASNVTIPLAKQPQVTMTTSLGSVVLELNPAKAPITVDNFLNYVESGFYVNKIFHRVIQDFMIQGGGFNADLTQPATQAPIKLEAGNGLSNLRGTIAMARTNVLDSATSQFFINVVDNQALDTNSGGYAVFGKVVSGIETVDKIKVVPTSTRGGMSDVPVTSVLINSMVQTQ